MAYLASPMISLLLDTLSLTGFQRKSDMEYFDWYNQERPYQALKSRTPKVVHEEKRVS
jgi:hypothetical protein